MSRYFCALLFMLLQVCFSVVYAGNLSGYTNNVKSTQDLTYSLGGDPIKRLIMTKNTDYTLTVTNTSGKALSEFLVLAPFSYIDRTHSTCLTTKTFQANARCVLKFTIPSEAKVHYTDYLIEFSAAGTIRKRAIFGILHAYVQPLTWVADNKGLDVRRNIVYIRAATDHKGVVYFAAPGGYVYRNNNTDNQWTSFDKGLPASSQYDPLLIVSMISADGLIYLSTSQTKQNGVFVTNGDDSGWVSDSKGLGNEVVTSFMSNDNILYAGTRDGRIYKKVLTGVEPVKTDATSQWEYVSSIPGKNNNVGVYSLLVFNHSIYAGTAGSGLYKSTDNGKSWVQVELGGKGKGGNNYVFNIVSLKNTLFVGTGYNGILKSTDNGKTWHQANNGITRHQGGINVKSLMVFGNSLYATAADDKAVYQSSNEGASWENIAAKQPFFQAGSMLIMSKGMLYIDPEGYNPESGWHPMGIYRQELVKTKGAL